jgi:hypothetical protein
MNNVEMLGEELREAITQFIVPLQTTRTVNQLAFDKLEHAARLLAAKLKGSDLVSKSLLKELYATAGIIRAEAPYIKGETAKLEKMAGQIQMIFDVILWGESCDDRKPGVPRVG